VGFFGQIVIGGVEVHKVQPKKILVVGYHLNKILKPEKKGTEKGGERLSMRSKKVPK